MFDRPFEIERSNRFARPSIEIEEEKNCDCVKAKKETKPIPIANLEGIRRKEVRIFSNLP